MTQFIEFVLSISLPSLARIDLGLLKLPAVIDVHGLPLAEGIEHRMRGLPVPVARILHTAEGQLHLGADRRTVDAGDSGLDIPDRPERAVDVS